MPRLVANTADMPEQDWLLLRKEGIGGSDASAVAGVNKYASPIMVYMDKLSLYLPDKKDNVREAAAWGHIHEPTIRAEFVKRENAKRAEQGKQPLKVVHRKAIFAHDEYDFIRTNLDGIVYDPDLGKGIFEAKTAHYMLREEWDGEDVPNAYFIQVQHNMLVMNVNYAWLAVLIGGNQFKYYFIPRDQEFIDYLIQIETSFWNNHILQRIPPEMIGSDAEKQMLNDQYPQSEGHEAYITALPNIAIELVERIDAYKELINGLQALQAADENEVKAMMGTNEMAFAGSHKVTWKTATNGVKTFRIRLDSEVERNKFHAATKKEMDKALKFILKERAEVEKITDRMRKEMDRIRRDEERAAEKLFKAEQKALEKAIKEKEKEEEKLAKAALKAEQAALKAAEKAAKENEKTEVIA